MLLYLWYKEPFSYALNKIVSAFYVFQMESGAVAVSFILNEKKKAEFMQSQDDQPQDDWHHWEEAVF